MQHLSFQSFKYIIVFAGGLFLASFNLPKVHAATVTNIIFPVIGEVRFTDDFGDPRVGHTHQGNDILGVKMLPLVSTVNGFIKDITYPQTAWGYSVIIQGDDGYTYHYLHINNDTPGTDDGRGGIGYAYAPGLKKGSRVVAGQLIGWLGDSGNAEGTPPHLHFEIRKNGMAFSPYLSLKAATKISNPIEGTFSDELSSGNIITAAVSPLKIAGTSKARNLKSKNNKIVLAPCMMISELWEDPHESKLKHELWWHGPFYIASIEKSQSGNLGSRSKRPYG